MIVFDLACRCGYAFEGWFQDRSDFEKHLQESLLVCPLCGSREVRKILSPISYQSSGRTGDPALMQHSSDIPVSPAEAAKALATLQKFVVENFVDVGADLANEALKIHYGISEPRNIRGVTSESEEKRLEEEGISLLKIPMPPKKDNVN